MLRLYNDKEKSMISRERMLAALAFQPVDIVPLQIHPSPGGLFDHGQKLLDLMSQCGHDFDDQSDLALPVVPKEDFDADGRYHKIRLDEWGTTWEHRLYGVWGYRIAYPLADMSRLATYCPPAIKPLVGAELEHARMEGVAHRKQYFHAGGGLSLFETMQSLRPFEEVLIDIASDTTEINQLADLLVEYNLQIVHNDLAAGVDAVVVGDDFGTQQNLMFSMKTWRKFFLPRYQRLFAPVKDAGKRIFFHSCGKIGPLLEDLRGLGVDAIWPQLPLFDHRQLAQQCRSLGLSVQLHPDRGELLQRATPQQVRAYILKLVEEFDCLAGGSWLYLEVDPGFPWENVKSMFETAMELRK
jgi:uroporphyrinogen decarboxylase